MRLRITEINQNAVAHVLRHKAAEAADNTGDAGLIGGSGSTRPDSAVEPTRSENKTVT